MIDGSALVDDDRPIPATPAHESMWFALHLAPPSAYHVPYRVRLDGPLDASVLHAALGDVVAHHEALRATFVLDGVKLWQRIRDQAAPGMPIVDLRERVDDAARLAKQIVREPFDLQRGPLLRAVLLRLAADRHELILVLHHLVFDGWSAKLFFAQLAEAYRTRLEHQVPTLAPAAPHPDAAGAQRAPTDTRRLEYWRRHLDGVAPLLPLRAAGHTPSADEIYRLRLPADLADEVRDLGRRHRCTPFMTMLAAYAVLLRAHTGHSDLVVGSPAADRGPANASVVGLFVNMLPLRITMTGDTSYRELLAQVRDTVLDGFGHQLPVERIIEELAPDRRAGHSPLFQAVYWLHPRQADPPVLHGCRTEVEELFNGAAKYDLTLGVRETPEATFCDFTYRGDVLGPDDAERLAAAYQAILAEMAARPDARLAPPASPPRGVEEPAPPRGVEEPAPPRGVEEPAPPSAPPATAAVTALAARVTAVWREVLDVPAVGPHDNFFDLGGHSRLMLQVRRLLAERLGTDVTILDLFDHPTVAALAAHLASRSPDGDHTSAGDDGHAERRRAGALRLRQSKGRTE